MPIEAQVLSCRALQVDGEGIRRALESAKQVVNPIDLSVGQPDFDVPIRIREALTHAINNGGNGYAPSGGLAELNAALQRSFAEQYPRWNFHGEDSLNDSVVCSGGTAAIYYALSAITDPGDEILIPDPEFLHYAEIVTLLGGVPVRVPTYPDFQVTAERIVPFISTKAKGLILSSPGNPTGAVVGRDSCKDLVELAQTRNFQLIVDEIYRDFYYSTADAPCPSVAEVSSNVVILRGFSKSHAMTGWRVGYAFGPRALIACMRKLQGLTIVSAPRPAQHAAIMAMEHPIADLVAEYRRRQLIVRREMADHFDLTPPDGGFYFFIPVPRQLGITASEFCRRALLHKVILVPGKAFSLSDTHFRLSLTAPSTALSNAIERLNLIATDDAYV